MPKQWTGYHTVRNSVAVLSPALLREIACAWLTAINPVVFSGAGMSTESGLADFRSAQGIWKTRPETLATLTAQRQQPDEFYHFYQWRIARLWEVQPNAGHIALAELEAQRRVKLLITQNVDGLHQRAGSVGVAELHGTLRTVSCLRCGAEFDSRILIPAQAGWEAGCQAGFHYGKECECSQCGGLLRPDVVLFGESLPVSPWEEAVAHSQAADFFVVIGSSLAVSPANLCPQLAVQNGAKLLIINREATPLDDCAAWVVRADAAVVLAQIWQTVRQQAGLPL
ncbi:MAG: NAD-dependent deacylase [Sporomusaceae bacterium]|nr:NAD-dependent deacylase [Sporomusaceae bacterium]